MVFSFYVYFAHTNGKSLLRVFDKKDGVGLVTPFWRFCTHYWYLLGTKYKAIICCMLFKGFYFFVATLLGKLVYCYILCDHCYCFFLAPCSLCLDGLMDVTDLLMGSRWLLMFLGGI